MQLGTPSALTGTGYGRVLIAKLLLLVPLLAFVGANRLWLTRPVLAGDGTATRRLAVSIVIELVLVAAILTVVALWRFTPPPRTIAPSPPSVTVESRSAKATARIAVTPGRAGSVRISTVLTGPDEALLPAKEMTLTFTHAAGGIGPIRRPATYAGGAWVVEGLTLPLPGEWTVQIAALITDFDLITIDATIAIAP